MMRSERIFSAIAAYPLTWLSFFIVIAMEWAFMAWFEPPMLIKFTAIGAGGILLLLWLIIFTRSETFWRRYNRMPEEIDNDELGKLLLGCHPAFRQAATECLIMVKKIRKEFKGKSFQDEVDWLMKNLTDLAQNHIQLYSRSREFGTEEQKQAMNDLIGQQVKSVEDSLVALKRFSGNLTLFDSQLNTQKEIDAELKTINQGLQEAIKEVLSP
jgi:hypothetical protein